MIELLILHFVTCLCSYLVLIFGRLLLVKDLAREGYKLNNIKLHEIDFREHEKDNSVFLVLIPIFNLIYPFFIYDYEGKNSAKKLLINSHQFIKMDEIEKFLYMKRPSLIRLIRIYQMKKKFLKNNQKFTLRSYYGDSVIIYDKKRTERDILFVNGPLKYRDKEEQVDFLKELERYTFLEECSKATNNSFNHERVYNLYDAKRDKILKMDFLEAIQFMSKEELTTLKESVVESKSNKLSLKPNND